MAYRWLIVIGAGPMGSAMLAEKNLPIVRSGLRAALAAALTGVVVVGAGNVAMAERVHPRPGASPLRNSYRATATAVTTGSATIAGSGFGHGVGLSQYGAWGMAKAGASAATILRHYYTGVQVAPMSDAVDVRVNVTHRSSRIAVSVAAVAGSTAPLARIAVGSTVVTLTPGDSAVLTPSSTSVRLAVTKAGTSVAAIYTGASAQVTWTGTRALPGSASTVKVASTASGSATVKNRSYRWGLLQVKPVAGLLETLAVVRVHDEYLRGIAEMPSSWAPAALQSQVVVARSYVLAALRRTPRPEGGGCNVWDDERSQVYDGWSKESEVSGGVNYGARWVDAVQATQSTSTTGTAVVFQGMPISAVYSSSSGGRTRTAQAVWGGSVAYLASVSDPWSVDPTINPSFARWNRSVAVPQLLRLFNLPNLVSVKVTDTDASGAATQVTAMTSTGAKVSISGEKFRSSLGLPSSWVGVIALVR